MSSDPFDVFIDGAAHFFNQASKSHEPLPASNDSWVLKLKPAVSCEKVASTYLCEVMEAMDGWNFSKRRDAFSRMMYASMSKTGLGPNVFFPDLGVFSQEVAMHTLIRDTHGHYAYSNEA